MPMFERYIGIDYSGAGEPDSPNRGIKVYLAANGVGPVPQMPDGKAISWSRKKLWAWLMTILGDTNEIPTVVGMDFAFSFPKSYFTGNALATWDQFLEHFSRICPTNEHRVSLLKNMVHPTSARTELRLTETWTTSAKGVFDFKPHGVAMSTFAGLPYIWLFRYPNPRVRHHFWPFDGWKIDAARKVICEVYPSIFRARCEYPTELNEHERDAFVVAKWLQERDQANLLKVYFEPPLTQSERSRAELEGWILGMA